METDDGKVNREIARRKRAEAALWESERRFQELVEISEDLIFTHDLEGHLRSVNPAMVRRLGYGKDEFLGRPLADFLSPPTKHEFPAYLERVAREGHAEGFLRVVTHGGEERVLRCENVLRTDERGDPVVFGVAHDVQRRWAEQALRISVNRLARDISERRRLEEQLVQSQKMEAIGTLAGGIAHDFNNILTVILGHSALLIPELPEGSPLRQDVEEIWKAGERAANLTGQLLAFSRKQVLAPVVLDLNAVVANVETMLRRLIGEDMDLVRVPASDLGRVRADASQLEQVLLNLVVNARDAMPQGGKITIETRNVDLDEAYAREHSYAAPGPYVLLSVSDTGVGMDAETRARIFEPFFTTKGPGKGTGLGLSTVYGIVKQSGGSVEVYSESGRGSVFKVYLPRVPESGVASPAASPSSESARGQETILLVEDEKEVRKLARLFLERAGYRVLEAESAEKAAAAAKEHAEAIDLLVTDTVLPGVDGPELARILQKTYSGLKVLFMSGYTDDAVVRNGVLESHQAFLPKPFTADSLTRKVREALDAPDRSG